MTQSSGQENFEIQWGLGRKVMLIFGGIAIVLVAVAAYFITGLWNVNEQLDQYQDTQTEVRKGQELQLYVANVWQFYTDASLTGDEAVIEEEAKPNLEKARETIDDLLQKYQKDSDRRQQLIKLREQLPELASTGQQMYEAYRRNQAAGNRMMGQYDEIAGSVIERADKLTNRINQTAEEDVDEIYQKMSSISRTLMIVTVLGFIGGLGAAYGVVRYLKRPLNRLMSLANSVARGNILGEDTREIHTTDELGAVTHAFNRVLESLKTTAKQAKAVANLNLNDAIFDETVEGDLGEAFQDMVGELREVAGQINRSIEDVEVTAREVDLAANELNDASQDLSEGTQQQSTTLEETSSSVEEIASMVQETSDNATESQNLTEKAMETVEDGEEKITDMANTMQKINQHSEDIKEAIDVIDDIAFQTNLLALNAAVEAANAGEHGEGFAVVADEVRQLAQRSAEAADEISNIIEESVEITSAGTEKAERSREVFTEVSEVFKQLKERVEEVDAATDEQSSGVEEINRAITELESVMEKTTASAEQTSSSSDELASQSASLDETLDNLRAVVERFDLENQDNPATKSPAERSEVETNGSRRQREGQSPGEDVIPLEEDMGGFE